MTAKQAYSILLTKNPAVKVEKCYEYDSIFVFHLKPDMLKLTVNPSPMLDSLLSVNKTTREACTFKPFDIPFDEYSRGVELPESAWK